MNMFLKLVLIFFVLFGSFVIAIGFVLPKRWQVSRSIIIHQRPRVIYPLVADFKQGWPKWSAFDNEDPTIQYSYSGPSLGSGASRSWISSKMGNGFQTVTAADPASGIQFELKMEKTNFKLNGKISFESAGKDTKVTWTDWGDSGNNLFFRYMSTMMDRMMGKAFEQSLENLKEKSEKTANR
jgi:hypothetical protein